MIVDSLSVYYIVKQHSSAGALIKCKNINIENINIEIL
jgi:hypothetical protein